MTVVRTLSLVCIVGLAGCDLFADDGDPQVSLSYAELNDRYFEIRDKGTWDFRNDVTPLASIPTTGSAAYGGVIVIETQQPTATSLQVLGDMTINVDFADDRFSGSARGFVDENEVAYSGVMTLTAGQIQRTDPLRDRLTSGVQATLVSPDRTLTLSDDALLQGSFYGGDEQFIVGRLNGELQTTEGPPIILDSQEKSVFTVEAQ